MGFKKSLADPCLYVKKQNGVQLMLLIFVDDLRLMVPDESYVKWFMSKIGKDFKLKHLGEIKKLSW